MVKDEIEKIKTRVQANLNINDDEFASIFEKATKTSISTGTVLFREGSHNEFVYFLVEGTADVHKDGQVINALAKGDIIGEMSLVGVDIASATVIATSECLLLKFKKDTFDMVLNRFPSLNSAIVLEAINRKLQQFGSVD